MSATELSTLSATELSMLSATKGKGRVRASQAGQKYHVGCAHIQNQVHCRKCLAEKHNTNDPRGAWLAAKPFGTLCFTCWAGCVELKEPEKSSSFKVFLALVVQGISCIGCSVVCCFG